MTGTSTGLRSAVRRRYGVQGPGSSDQSGVLSLVRCRLLTLPPSVFLLVWVRRVRLRPGPSLDACFTVEIRRPLTHTKVRFSAITNLKQGDFRCRYILESHTGRNLHSNDLYVSEPYSSRTLFTRDSGDQPREYSSLLCLCVSVPVHVYLRL